VKIRPDNVRIAEAPTTPEATPRCSLISLSASSLVFRALRDILTVAATLNFPCLSRRCFLSVNLACWPAYKRFQLYEDKSVLQPGGSQSRNVALHVPLACPK
jgi:hypothetical protein